jgi:DNA-binding beta-propeller fold protein YncE
MAGGNPGGLGVFWLLGAPKKRKFLQRPPAGFSLGLFSGALMLFLSLPAFADLDHCQAPEAQGHLDSGMALQAELESESAVKEYSACLEKEPGCVACRYEMGWSYWKLGEWRKVVDAWEEALKKAPGHPKIPQFLPTARENLRLVQAKQIPNSFVSGVEVGKRSEPAGGPLSLLLLARRQSYNPQPLHPMDYYDQDIQSPKSVRFSRDGKKVYVNSLEGARTVVYDALGLKKLAVIRHHFTADDKSLFLEKKPPWGYRFPKMQHPNEFYGKPVELELSHNGRYLWAPYYRRSYDETGAFPSAVAVIDTREDKIVRVMAVGPIAKYVKRSHGGRWMAVSHWGDNTVGLIDIRSQKPEGFRPEHLLVVEKRADASTFRGDRDRNCGFCVRGLAFSQDDRYLFVTRMKGGGIAVFRLFPKGKRAPVYLGTLFGLVPGARDSVISSKGDLFVSCNASGMVAKVPWKNVVKKLGEIKPGTAYGKRSLIIKPKDVGAVLTYVGMGARSLRLSHDERTLFVTVNQSSELVGVDTASMQMEARIPVDSFPVGLDLSPDDSQVWVTSQGRSAKGGNSVGIFQARYKTEEIVPAGRAGDAEAGKGLKPMAKP